MSTREKWIIAALIVLLVMNGWQTYINQQALRQAQENFMIIRALPIEEVPTQR